MDNQDRSDEIERRMQKRLETALPVQILGVDAQGTQFEEITETVEVSRRGLSFLTRHELKPFATVTLLIPGRGPGHAGEGQGPTDFFATAAVINVVEEAGLYRVSLRFIGASLTTYSPETT